MRALDYKSVSTVATHVDGLIARGWLVKKDNSARTLEVVGSNAETTAHIGTIANSAEQVLLAKIEELRGIDNNKHTKQIETLREALRILGYDSADKRTIV